MRTVNQRYAEAFAVKYSYPNNFEDRGLNSYDFSIIRNIINAINAIAYDNNQFYKTYHCHLTEYEKSRIDSLPRLPMELLKAVIENEASDEYSFEKRIACYPDQTLKNDLSLFYKELKEFIEIYPFVTEDVVKKMGAQRLLRKYELSLNHLLIRVLGANKERLEDSAAPYIIPNVLEAIKALAEKRKFEPILGRKSEIKELSSSPIEALYYMLTMEKDGKNYFKEMIADFCADDKNFDYEDLRYNLNEFLKEATYFARENSSEEDKKAPLITMGSKEGAGASSQMKRNSYLSDIKWSVMAAVIAGFLVKTGLAIRLGLTSNWRTALRVAGVLFASFEGIRFVRDVQKHKQNLQIVNTDVYAIGQDVADNKISYYGLLAWKAYLISPNTFWEGYNNRKNELETNPQSSSSTPPPSSRPQ